MQLKLFVLYLYSLFSASFILGSYPPAPFFYLNIITAPQQDPVLSNRFTDAELQTSNFLLSKHLQEICEYQRTGQIPCQLLAARHIESNVPKILPASAAHAGHQSSAGETSTRPLSITEYVPENPVPFKAAPLPEVHSESMLKKLKKSESIIRVPRVPIIHNPCDPS